MDFVYATSTMQVVTPDGGRQTVRQGEHWPPGDPVVLAAPAGLFTADGRSTMRFTVRPPEADEPPVEQATAAPGERRNTRRG